MKTRFNIEIGSTNIEVKGVPVQTPPVTIDTEVEFSIGEAKGLYDLQKQIMGEFPELFRVFATEFATAMRSVDDHVEKLYEDRNPIDFEEGTI